MQRENILYSLLVVQVEIFITRNTPALGSAGDFVTSGAGQNRPAPETDLSGGGERNPERGEAGRPPLGIGFPRGSVD